MKVHGLTKRYGRVVALDHLTLAVPEGAIFGLLGPNASGKSTLFRLLMGFIFPDSGTIDREGIGRDWMGYVPERPQFSPRLTFREYLVMIATLCGKTGMELRHHVDACLRQVELDKFADRRIGTGSKGMLQRLAVAQALVNEPRLLLLDEPTGGLDPASQKELRDLIRTLPSEGKTVLLSTHQLAEAGELCTHVAILDRGRLVRAGGVNEVLRLRPRVTILVNQILEPVAAPIEGLHPDVHIQGQCILLEGEAIELKAEVLRLLLEAHVDIIRLEQERTTLEELYLEAVHP